MGSGRRQTAPQGMVGKGSILARFMEQRLNNITKLSFGLLDNGILGNLTDRIVRGNGG
jgi:hypothetical protein